MWISIIRFALFEKRQVYLGPVLFLVKVLDSDVSAASHLAKVIHEPFPIEDEQRLVELEIEHSSDDVGIWIDPIGWSICDVITMSCNSANNIVIDDCQKSYI